jgi:hypothetical protein
MTYLPPKVPPTPKQAAALRAQRIAMALRALIWLAALVPIVGMLMAYGYSDQAPAFLRGATVAIDGFLGRPVWALIGPKG